MALLIISLILIVYHYLLYPVAMVYLAQLHRFRQPPVVTKRPTSAQLPRVSLIIAAYNEERVIDQKIENSLALDYPAKKLEIIVVSDGSSDTTPERVSAYADRDVVSLHQAERRGKTAALNRAIEQARGEIIVFSDANNDFNPDAIRALVTPFADPAVGGVNGVKRIRADDDREAAAGDGFYWLYESVLKQAESDLGSITGADGEIFAMRKSLFIPIDTTLINDDAALTFQLVKGGHRILYEPGAVSYEAASIQIEDDFQVKVRMVAGGFQTLAREAAYLFPPRNAFSWQFLSHKMLRWLMPELLVILFFLSLVYAGNPLIKLLLVLQAGFYLLALAGWVRRRESLPFWLYFPFYFVAMNGAALFGLIRFLRGQQSTLWAKAAR